MTWSQQQMQCTHESWKILTQDYFEACFASSQINEPGGFDWQETPVIKDCNDKMDRLQPLLDFHIAFWKRRHTDRQMDGKWKQRVPWFTKCGKNEYFINLAVETTSTLANERNALSDDIALHL